MEKEKKTTRKPDILAIMAIKNNLEPTQFLNTIKSTIMKPGKDGRIATNEEIAAFLIVANKYNLDPFTNEIYAFPSKKGGIVPVVGIDGFVSMMNRNKDFNGMDIEFSEEMITMEGAKSCPEWCEVRIYRKGIEKPIIVREYLDEVYCPPKGGYPGPWQSHTKRLLRHKTIIQANRIAFGITGIYDPDEADRILEAEAIGPTMKPTVETPQAIEEQPQPEQPTQEQSETLPESNPSAPNLISEAQVKRLYAIAKSFGYKEEDVKQYLLGEYNIESAKGISKEQYDEIVSHFQSRKV